MSDSDPSDPDPRDPDPSDPDPSGEKQGSEVQQQGHTTSYAIVASFLLFSSTKNNLHDGFV